MKTFLILFVCLLFFISASNAEEAGYKDGTYEGEHSFVKTSTTVKDGKIADVTILEHGGGGKKYEDMVKPLTGKMVEKQSTDVDAVTGATVSSESLKKAVEKGLEKAKK